MALVSKSNRETNKKPQCFHWGFSISIVLERLASDLLLSCFFLFFNDFFASCLVNNFHGKAYLATVVKAQQFNLNFLALFKDVRRVVQTAVFDLGNVDQTIAFAKEVHECTKVYDLNDRTGVNHAFFWLSYD